MLRRLAWVALLMAVTVHAASPVDVFQFPDAQLEARYRSLIAEFRCPKCLNTNLAGSDAPIARDLRVTVHRLVTREAFSDAEVRAFLQARYGDFVLYDPPFRPGTYLLWFGPGVFVVLGLVLVGFRLAHQKAAQLSSQDQARLQAILGDETAEELDDALSDE
ncbi:MAG: cytochrome c-type biogenesis protein CcmH [Gammaproteobacteria bacterium]|nr:cytochrome c-type biogenesis protein CcmH [Gammaproteobacteria bacterium]